MLTIHLKDLIFYSYHGLFPEEGLLGTEFKVNIEVKYHPGGENIYNISNSIDYVSVFELVKKIMDQPTPLLETIVQIIAGSILKNYQIAEEVFVMIEKCHPPITGFQGSVGVSILQRRIN